jgi:two-component system, LytTR family, sensor histidine kinase AlgZ
MHPLLTPINRFGLYLLAWVPLAGILIYLMAVPGRLGWLDATVLMLPLCLIYQFVCLSAWYSCKAAPIQKGTGQRLWITHVLAASILSLFWVLLARLLAYALSELPAFRGLNSRFAAQVPVLFGAGFLLYLLSVASHYVILAIEDSNRAEVRVQESSILARDAELKALKAQVNPHFLFNSLNSISALTSVDPAKAREMCILLAEFLRMTLGLGERTSVPLSEELSLLRRYLAIEKVRFGARLQMEEDVQEISKSVQLPPLLLQPLVENAIIHGIANLPDGGTIRLSGQNHNGRVSLAIENTFDPESTPTRKGGLGLNNVRDRLAARYGKDANMSVSAKNGKFRVVLSIPADTSDSEGAKSRA